MNIFSSGTRTSCHVSRKIEDHLPVYINTTTIYFFKHACSSTSLNMQVNGIQQVPTQHPGHVRKETAVCLALMLAIIAHRKAHGRLIQSASHRLPFIGSVSSP
jgi:hypothetical protein